MYEGYLKALLEPLGVYDFGESSINGAELGAMGSGLDAVYTGLEFVEREALLATAEEIGLAQREALFVRRPVAVTAKERRAAITALLQIDGDSLTPADMERTIQGCGIRAQIVEMGEGKLRVYFPEVVGIPEEFQNIETIILEILPCHLEIEFYFRYITWQECHDAGYTWDDIATYTWKEFQCMVSLEE